MTAVYKLMDQVESTDKRPLDRWDLAFVCVLILLTAATRIANRGALYFVDGPRIVWSIRVGLYTIQPPGYLTLAHLAALFRDPAFGLAFWAVTFSSVGSGAFYLLCRLRQSDRLLCLLAALGFMSVYYVWFAGEIHSSYASQILFPSLALFCFFRSQANNSMPWTMSWALAAAAGMALRPSDGVFLVPLWVYLLLRYKRQVRVWATFIALNLIAYLAWYIPTQHALAFSRQGSTGTTILMSMHTTSLLFTGINGRSLANLARVVVPLMVAFWALTPAVFTKRTWEDNRVAAIWAVPGLCFFALGYMADPTYLVFLTGAIFWLVITAYNRRRALVSLSLCIVFNAGLFLFAEPLREAGLAHQIGNFYVVKYCRYGIQHQWSSTVGDGGRVP